MRTFRLFLLTLCLALPFADAFVDNAPQLNIELRPIVIKRNQTRIQTSVTQLAPNKYAVTFGNTYSDVIIEVYDEEGYLIGCVEADYVTTGDVIIVRTSDTGAVELTVFSGDDVVYSTEL